MKTILNEALAYLITCIDEGLEYPDAPWYAVDTFNLTNKQGEALTNKQGEALTNLYDECGGILE